MTPQREDPVLEALEELRAIEPSDELKARLEHALILAERREQCERRERKKKQTARWHHLRLCLPALASVAIAGHLLIVEPDIEEPLVTEHRLELPEAGHAALPISLALDEHDSEFASVRLDVPHGVRVMPSQHAISSGEPACSQASCVYEFVHPTESSVPHLEVQVEKPGRYRLRVEHVSESKTLRETIVVHARR